MKKSQFHYRLLTLSVAAFMGLNVANAASNNEVSAPAAAINNKATASYSIGTVAQPVVESNIVTVNVTETANFSLVSLVVDNDDNVDTAINQTATPGGTTTFTHKLSNVGNVRDTYTIRTTGNDEPTITTATPDYALGVADISYVIKQADGSALTTAQISALNDFGQTTTTGTVVNGGTIKLLPGLIAELSYAAATPSSRNGNDKGVGTLTATSTFFTNAGASKATLINENQTLVRLPVFKIEKTATCGTTTPCTTLDLTAATPTIDYSIKVTNATTNYSAEATGFVIRDVLPAGMTLSGNVTANGASVTSSGRTADNRQIIDVAVASLAVGANQLISFKVTVDKTKYTSANSAATNNVAVYDKFAGSITSLPVNPTTTTDYDILDSTVSDNDITRIPNAAVTPTGPVTITYTPPNGTTTAPITLTAVNGVYTINSTVLPSGIAKGGTVAINYGMTSTNAIIGSSETSIVRLTAGGNGAPTVPAVTDTTNVKGLTLLK